MKIISLALTLLLLSSCALSVVPQASGGDESQAIVEFSYIDYPLVPQRINWVPAEQDALQRCQAWGFTQVTRYEVETQECLASVENACTQYRNTARYQCFD